MFLLAALIQTAGCLRQLWRRSFIIWIFAMMIICWSTARMSSSLERNDRSVVVFECNCGEANNDATISLPMLVAMVLFVLCVLVRIRRNVLPFADRNLGTMFALGESWNTGSGMSALLPCARLLGIPQCLGITGKGFLAKTLSIFDRSGVGLNSCALRASLEKIVLANLSSCQTPLESIHYEVPMPSRSIW
jgi:hypothetical protein